MESFRMHMILIFYSIFSGFLVFLAASSSSSSDTLRQGDILNSSSSTFLVSARKLFTLGFYRPGNSDSNYSYLGIGYPEYDRPLWVANRNNPVINNSGVLTIDSLGKLIITHDGGKIIEVYGGSQTGTTNITGTLLDTGNFVVRDLNNNNRSLWESFDYPADVLLPGMKLGINHRTGRNWSLTSWFSPTIPAPGAFTLEWDPKGRRLVVKRRGVMYWTSGVLEGKKGFEFMPAAQVTVFRYTFTNVTGMDEEYFTYSATVIPDLSVNGERRISWELNSGEAYIAPADGGIILAEVFRCYGYNTDYGCCLWKQPNCRNSSLTFELRSGSFGDTDKPSFHDENKSLSLSDCRENCWNDCNCVGYRQARDDGSGCLFWNKNLEFHLDVSGASTRSYVLNVSDDQPATLRQERRKKQIWIPTAAALAVGFILVVFSFLCYLKRRKGKDELIRLMAPNGSGGTNELGNDGSEDNDLKVFGFGSIIAATDRFAPENKLGEGGFGPVYKGRLIDGREIAVKLLSRMSEQGVVEFKTELMLVAKLQHVNLVRLLGFCVHGVEKMLIYEYMVNKSLDSFLFDPSQKEKLTWEKRFNIIEGIAQALLYLHQYSRLKIVHRDLKASNVLLDQNMNPKISDFGMARIFKETVLEVKTERAAGTLGYMAPEYAMEGIFSIKSDVFSFGVLLLEIVSGRRNNSFHHVDEPLNLVGYAWDLWNKTAALELMDPMLNDSHSKQVLRCIHVALLCVEHRAIDRPTMSDVIFMLTNDNIALPMPKKPAFLSGSTVVEENSCKSNLDKYSANGLSISVMDARETAIHDT